MAIGDWTPKIWSARFTRKLEDNLVWLPLTNQEYTPEVVNYGDTIEIPTFTKNFTISDYTIGTDLGTPERADGGKVTLNVNKQKAFNFAVDDITQRQSRPNVIQRSMNGAVFNMAAQVEADIEAEFAGNIAAARLTTVNAEVGANNHGFAIELIADLNEVHAKMDALNVPREGRWAVFPRQAWTPLNTYILNLDSTPVAADDTLRNAFTGRLFGFDTYLKGTVMRASKTFLTVANTEVQRIVCGQGRNHVAHVMQIQNVETLRMARQFADEVRGLNVYGTKTIEGTTLQFIEFKDVNQSA